MICWSSGRKSSRLSFSSHHKTYCGTTHCPLWLLITYRQSLFSSDLGTLLNSVAGLQVTCLLGFSITGDKRGLVSYVLCGLLIICGVSTSPLRLIAREMARIHAIHAHNGCIPKPNLWIKMRKYFSLVTTEFTDQASNIR